MDWRDHLMRMALRLGPALLIITSFLALMIGVIWHGISVNEFDYRNPPATHFKPDLVIGKELDNNLMWFLQVTDLHLSNRGESARETDFIELCDKYVDIFQPDAVLVTGDITDGRKPNTTFGTGQQLDEWKAYANAIAKSEPLKKGHTKWFDIRGNHDNFNVFRPRDPSVPFRQYSIMGKEHSRNYIANVTKGDKRYTFIGVDEVQTPGVKIFNFIGVVKEEDLSELKEYKNLAKEMNSEYTIWFAHYPTACLVSPKEDLRSIIDGPYLCGHYHTIGNLVTQMHATQQPGFAEVELGDWKHNRRVRLASVDHQLFNFVDFKFRDFPVALMTNPKRSEYSMPKLEPVDRIAKSTHIRVIAFSNATDHKIKSVEISIDGGPKLPLKHSDGPLWTRPWNPRDYPTGLHTVNIFVEDSAGLSRDYEQHFSFDNSKREFTIGARVLLRAHFRTIVMSLFYFIVIVCTLPMLALRLVSYRHREAGLKRHYNGCLLYKVHQLCNIPRLFTPLFIIPIWIAVGPHFIGYMVDEAVGACFAWGILVDGTLVHTGITFNVGSIFLLFVHGPEVILLTYQVGCSYKSLQRTDRPASLLSLRIIIHIFVLTMMQIFMGFLLYSGQGFLALTTSFPYVWCIFIYAYCWYQCTKLEKSDFSGFELATDAAEQRPLTSQRTKDDKSSASDQSTC